MRKAILLSIVMPGLLACATLAAPIAALKRTATPSPSATPMPTHSLSPTPSDTPEPTETSTPAPTATPQPTPLPTIAILYTAPPLSPTSGLLNCQLNWQSPGNGITYDPEEVFTVGWNVKNTGNVAWEPGSVEFTWVAGAKMNADPVVRLKASVAPGEAVVLSVHMRAPRNSTLYTTHWSLRQGDVYFCPLALWIYVD